MFFRSEVDSVLKLRPVLSSPVWCRVLSTLSCSNVWSLLGSLVRDKLPSQCLFSPAAPSLRFSGCVYGPRESCVCSGVTLLGLFVCVLPSRCLAGFWGRIPPGPSFSRLSTSCWIIHVLRCSSHFPQFTFPPLVELRFHSWSGDQRRWGRDGERCLCCSTCFKL